MSDDCRASKPNKPNKAIVVITRSRRRRTVLAEVTGQTAKLDDLQAQRLQLDHQFVDGFLIRQRAVHDCLDARP